MFFTFLIVHLLVWSCIGLIRVVLPTDTLEGIYWGSLYDFGTPKHPPLAGWITYLAYLPFKIESFDKIEKSVFKQKIKIFRK